MPGTCLELKILIARSSALKALSLADALHPSCLTLLRVASKAADGRQAQADKPMVSKEVELLPDSGASHQQTNC